MFVPSQRNFDKIQFEALRKKIDGAFNLAHDELSVCYYNYWKLGESKPFRGYDVQMTPEESKILFDKLHGLIFLLRDVVFHQENLKQLIKDRIPEEQYNFEFGALGEHTGKKSDLVLQKIQEFKVQGIEIIV